MKIERSDLFLGLITVAASFLYAVAGGAVGEIPTNTLARINTPGSDCGPWDLKKNADRRVRDFDNLLLAKKESRAANYGRDCYASHSVYTPGRCDFFETSEIEYKPIEELQVGRPLDSYMTAIFISPCRIVYNGRCEDPLFLATDDLGDFGLPNKYYREDPRARVLIAIDEMEVCREKDVDCFPPYESNPDFGIEYEFVRTALRRTSSFQSIQSRLGQGLVAAESISDFESRQLDKEQWIIESKALFNTSLARLQFNILDMAAGNHPTGAAAGGFESAYENSTPAWARQKMTSMCDNYKFNMSGPYTNINSLTFLILLVPILLFAFSRNMDKPSDTDEVPPLEGDWKVFDRMIWLARLNHEILERMRLNYHKMLNNSRTVDSPKRINTLRKINILRKINNLRNLHKFGKIDDTMKNTISTTRHKNDRVHGTVCTIKARIKRAQPRRHSLPYIFREMRKSEDISKTRSS
ncbi:hypothetical protein LQW54_006634 [Pestalotiopsis sp. IQ-011]